MIRGVMTYRGQWLCPLLHWKTDYFHDWHWYAHRRVVRKMESSRWKGNQCWVWVCYPWWLNVQGRYVCVDSLPDGFLKGKGWVRERYRSRVALSSFDILICTYMWVNWRAVRSCNKPAHDLNAHYLLKDQAIIKLDQVYWNEAKRRLMTGALRA